MSAIEVIIGEAIGIFKDFIYRDIFYIVGGISVIYSFIFCFQVPTFTVSGYIIIYVIFISYVIGYVLQEIFSIIGLVITAFYKPGKFIIWFANRFSKSESWGKIPEPNSVDLSILRKCLDEHCTGITRKRINRTINLKQVGSSMGSSMFTTCIFLFGGWIHNDSDKWVLYSSFAILVLSLFLVLINRIKQAQQSLFEISFYNNCSKCKDSALIEPENKA